jgi:hypothetical protein
MKFKNLFFSAAIIIAFTAISSCSKNENPADISLFYGRWKSDVGDTITFSQRNGENIFSYSTLTLPSIPSEVEFSYRNNKLRLKDDVTILNKFRTLETFTWVQQGASFQVLGADIYRFMSSTSTYFTFIKMQ